MCRMGFEHHVAVNISQKADTIAEALDTYMGWEVYQPARIKTMILPELPVLPQDRQLNLYSGSLPAVQHTYPLQTLSTRL
jgi:hypothetical protein